MTGNDQIRFCDHCSLSVHNLSEMTSKQVLRLIGKSHGRVCIRYIRRPGGALATSTSLHASAGKLHRIGRRVSKVAAGAFTASLSISGAAAQTTECSGSSCNNSAVSQIDTRWHPRASIVGKVTTLAGAPIPAASIAIFNERTQAGLFTSGNFNGEFRFEGLESGIYTVRFEAPGFSPVERKGVYLGENMSTRVDQTLSTERLETPGDEEQEQEHFVVTSGVVAIVAPKDPFIRAAQEDDLEKVTALLAGRDVNLRDKDSATTALEHAVRNANREMVQLLLSAGANVNAQNRGGETVLMMMDQDATSDLVWDLINAGAKVELINNGGNTALMEAASTNNQELLKTLLEAGANVNVKNKQGQTALMMAASEGLVNNIRTLILAGAEVNALDKEGKNALFYATDNTQSAATRLLKSHGSVEVVAKKVEEQ
jgi:hypothetical protein